MTGSVQDRERSGARASSGLKSFFGESTPLIRFHETLKKHIKLIRESCHFDRPSNFEIGVKY